MTWKGESIDLSAITKTALMTVEGEKDDIGYARLHDELGANTPDGSGVRVTQAEAYTGTSPVSTNFASGISSRFTATTCSASPSPSLLTLTW